MAVAFARAFVQVQPDMRSFRGEAEKGVAKAGLEKSGDKAGTSFGRRFGTSAAAAIGPALKGGALGALGAGAAGIAAAGGPLAGLTAGLAAFGAVAAPEL